MTAVSNLRKAAAHVLQRNQHNSHLVVLAVLA